MKNKKNWSKVLKQGLQVLFHISWQMKLFQGNSDIMIDSCTYIYIHIYTQVSVRDITLECLQITVST